VTNVMDNVADTTRRPSHTRHLSSPGEKRAHVICYLIFFCVLAIFRIRANEDVFDDVVEGSGTVELNVLRNDVLLWSGSQQDRDYMVITDAEGHGETDEDVCRPSRDQEVVIFDFLYADIGWNHCQYKVCYDGPGDERFCDIAKIEVDVIAVAPVSSPNIKDDEFYIEEGVKTRVTPLENDRPRPRDAGPLEINGLLRTRNIRLPSNLDDFQYTADLVLDRTIYELNDKTDSVKGGVCRRTGNKEDVYYDPPRNFDGLDACVYEAIDADGNTGLGVIFFVVEAKEDDE